MKAKTISCTLDPKSIDQAIRELNDWKVNWLEDRCHKLLVELANNGAFWARTHFGNAVYDGDRTVKVDFEERGDDAFAVIAMGKSAVFIEFGSGVRYPDDHPLAHSMGMFRGMYGAGKGGSPKGWTYYGEPGSHGKRLRDGVYRTYGNPANQCMYRTMQELRENFEKIARRIFQ